jgi:hypothetical protein
MMRTEAWKSLKANDIAVFLAISARYAGPGSNNGRIPFATRDGAKMGLGKTAVSASLKRLQERGFIVCEKRGGFNLKDGKRASEWRLTDHPSDISSELATREYQQWSAQIQNTGPVARPTGSVARQSGVCSKTETDQFEAKCRVRGL